jgi:hypothetical protein
MTHFSPRSLASILGTFALTFALTTSPSQSTALGPRGTQPCGPSFQVVNSPDPAPIAILEDVAAISSTDVWAVGYDIEHWDGAEWSVVPGTNHDYLWGAAAASSSDVWAVGTDYSFAHTLIRHWDGTTWTKVPSPNTGSPSNELQDVAVVAPDDVWAVGFSSNDFGTGRTLIEHWDGTGWTIVPSPSPGSSSLDGLAVVSSDDVWAVGGFDNKTLVEHWNGTAWSLVQSPFVGRNPYYLDAAVAFGANDVWAVGAKEGNQRTLVEHWDGTAWKIVYSPPGNGGLFNVAASSPGDIWATSVQAFNPLVEHWDGSRWSIVTVPDSDGNSQLRPSGVGALPSGEVWIVGYNTTPFTTMKQHMCPTQVLDSGFSPAASDVGRGLTAAWDFPAADASSHTVTDATGLGLFDSGSKLPGTSFTFRFAAAGTYAIVDTLFPSHVESIAVPVDAQPPTGTPTTAFQIAWGTGVLPGYLFDIQIMRPGNPTWSDWQTGVTISFASFTPDSGTGTYSFRGRLRNVSNGASSDWSPIASITVTP